MAVRFSRSELGFLERMELCRLATVDELGRPHVVPICYVFAEGAFYMVTDPGTKKHRNLQRNPYAALVVDVYRPNRAVMVTGKAELLTAGEEFRRASQAFYERFEWARRDFWDEGEAVVIKLVPERKVSWGLGRGPAARNVD
ncbi:MAG: pyridoxamine 5'-phosphate oxidase family protein [Aigarchaeota archaeon]|nr:pyridoxamine 5'-phosphate oxidase family protein [Aigarchaeota archaeon]MCX8203242.1 pyridoxamine 5'-phosphate oxidase family protein [Nitrososphaeria archaeon]MDW8043624.1 pyridoxamine 5'-phosphate oxidase family protein [Nitrososphaerota archaeon]